MEAFVPVDGGQLWTDAEGEGVPVMFISGGPGCCDYLEPVAGMLEGVAQTVRFDARGCGRSTLLETYTLDGALADLETIREHYGFEQWIVVGHSAGADHAIAYALRSRSAPVRSCACRADAYPTIGNGTRRTRRDAMRASKPRWRTPTRRTWM